MIRFLQSGSRGVKWIISGFLLVICGAMVITLIPGGFLTGDTANSEGVLAKVAGEDVTTTEATTFAQNMARQQFGGRSVPPQIMPFFVSQAVDNLITGKAMQAEAQRMGLTVSNEELRQALRRIPDLYPNGQFVGEAAYEQMVEQGRNMTVAEFERQVKQSLLMEKLRNVVSGSVTVSDDAVRDEWLRRNTKVKFDYAVLTNADVEKLIHPTDAELRAFFDKNKARYASVNPEKRKAQYILVEASKLKSAQVTDDDVKRYYNQHMDQYRVPDEVMLRHIVIRTPAGADQKTVDAAKAKAEDVLKQVRAGGDFAALAKKYSEDEGTKDNGGSLGWITRGRLPELDNVIFSMQKGQVSDVVKSSYGFHILKADDKHTAHVKPLDEVKEQIRPVVAADKEQQETQREANSLVSTARAMGMQKAADKEGQPLQTTDLIPRTAPNLPQGLAEAIFSAREKDPPDLVKVPQGYAVFQVTEVKPPQPPTFEEAKSAVEADYKREKTASLLQERSQQLAEKAKSEHNLRAAAKEFGIDVKTSDLVGPESQVPDIGSLRGPASVVFSMKQGEISNPISAGRGSAVVALVQRQEPAATEFAGEKDKLRDELLDTKRTEALRIFMTNLRDKMQKDGKIKINEKEMQRIGASGRGLPGQAGM